jgi:hypothetical protein
VVVDNSTFSNITNLTTNITHLEGQCECDQFWVTDTVNGSANFGFECSYEIFHWYGEVIGIPCAVILLAVLLRHYIAKLCTLCCRRNPKCCCTACCVRHRCVPSAAGGGGRGATMWRMCGMAARLVWFGESAADAVAVGSE